jgi:hypothetical protein
MCPRVGPPCHWHRTCNAGGGCGVYALIAYRERSRGRRPGASPQPPRISRVAANGGFVDDRAAYRGGQRRAGLGRAWAVAHTATVSDAPRQFVQHRRARPSPSGGAGEVRARCSPSPGTGPCRLRRAARGRWQRVARNPGGRSGIARVCATASPRPAGTRGRRNRMGRLALAGAADRVGREHARDERVPGKGSRSRCAVGGPATYCGPRAARRSRGPHAGDRQGTTQRKRSGKDCGAEGGSSAAGESRSARACEDASRVARRASQSTAGGCVGRIGAGSCGHRPGNRSHGNAWGPGSTRLRRRGARDDRRRRVQARLTGASRGQ